MAIMVDNLQFLSWTKTKSAQKGKDKPKSIFNKLMGFDEEPKDELKVFETPEEYEAWRQQKREEWTQNGGNNSNSLHTD